MLRKRQVPGVWVHEEKWNGRSSHDKENNRCPWDLKKIPVVLKKTGGKCLVMKAEKADGTWIKQPSSRWLFGVQRVWAFLFAK